jgi:Zn finger protein HypA/HybF involved in hydrogenase expression
MKYFKARVGELSDTTTAEVCSSLTETLEYESPFPDYLHIRNMEEDSQTVDCEYCNTVFEINTKNGTICPNCGANAIEEGETDD